MVLGGRARHAAAPQGPVAVLLHRQLAGSVRGLPLSAAGALHHPAGGSYGQAGTSPETVCFLFGGENPGTVCFFSLFCKSRGRFFLLGGVLVRRLRLFLLLVLQIPGPFFSFGGGVGP